MSLPDHSWQHTTNYLLIANFHFCSQLLPIYQGQVKIKMQQAELDTEQQITSLGNHNVGIFLN